MKKNKALLIVDFQNDFCPGGALAVKGGDVIAGTLNAYIDLFQKKDIPIFVSRDWHPAQSRHFKIYGGPWPVHCVRDTPGAQFHPQLRLPEGAVVISKGTAEDSHGYSVFEGHDDRGFSLLRILQDLDVESLFIGGLAMDYCVKASSLDALKNGFEVYLLSDAIKGVNLQPQDSQHAVEEMLTRGAQTISIENLPKVFEQ